VPILLWFLANGTNGRTTENTEYVMVKVCVSLSSVCLLFVTNVLWPNGTSYQNMSEEANWVTRPLPCTCYLNHVAIFFFIFFFFFSNVQIFLPVISYIADVHEVMEATTKFQEQESAVTRLLFATIKVTVCRGYICSSKQLHKNI